MSVYQDVFKHWHLDPVINACGTKTTIGASRVCEAAIEAVNGILPRFVSIDQLQARAGEVISRVIGTEAGCVTACSASAITTGVAATIAGTDLSAIEKLPDCGLRQNRVAMQMGHMIHYGAPIPQAIALAGAETVTLGTAARCETYHLEAALKEGLASVVFVISHHTVREEELPLENVIEICHAFDVPVIVDMASEYDMETPVRLGADLIIYSGHKFMGGTTSGIVAGKKELIRAVYLQNRGIGRVMKVGKEGIVGAMAALEHWFERDATAVSTAEAQIRAHWMKKLGDAAGLSITEHEDWTGNPITRLRIDVNSEKTGIYAWELSERLAGRKPKIMVRDDLVEKGLIFLDPCNLDFQEAEQVADAILDELSKTKASGDGCRKSWSDVKRSRSRAPLLWP